MKVAFAFEIQEIASHFHFKKPEPKMPYSPKETAGILNAVKVARESGTWEDAFTKAHAAGYQGSLSYLRKMVAERNKQAGVARRKQRSERGK